MLRSILKWCIPKLLYRRYSQCSPPAPLVPASACNWSVLPNGVRVITEQTCSRLACVSLFVEAGPRFEECSKNGICNLIEFLAYKGFARYDRVSFLHYVDSIGAKLWAKTTREYQAFIGTCLNNNVGDLINIYARIICDLEIGQCELEWAKKQYAENMSDEDRNPKMMVFDFIHEGAFHGTSLGQTVAGPYEENILCFDKSTIQSFIASHYQPFRLIVSVSSSWSHSDVMCSVQNDMGCMKKEDPVQPVYWPCRYSGTQVLYRDDDMDFAHCVLALEAPGITSLDNYYVFLMMKSLLGTWHASQCQGLSTWPRLSFAAEVDKLCIHYEPFYIPYRDVGLFGIYYVSSKGTELDDMIWVIQAFLKHLCLSTIPPEVDRARSVLQLSMAKEVDGCINTCIDNGLQMMYFGCRRSITDKWDAIKYIDNIKIKDFAMKWIFDRVPVTAAIGPTETFPDINRIQSGMYFLAY